jgi:hypothetical protein
MARPRIAMSADEVDAFLGGKQRAVAGSRDAAGAPDGEPATYTWRDGALVFAVAADGPTARNLAGDPRVVLSVEEFPAYARIKGVAVHGRAVSVGRDGEVARFRMDEARVESFDFTKSPRRDPPK